MTGSDSADDVPTRQPGWNGIWAAPADDPRDTDGSGGGGERSALTDYLRRYRPTLQLKCAGLSADQLALRSVARQRPPTGSRHARGQRSQPCPRRPRGLRLSHCFLAPWCG
jgi:hypothetical protein